MLPALFMWVRLSIHANLLSLFQYPAGGFFLVLLLDSTFYFLHGIHSFVGDILVRHSCSDYLPLPCMTSRLPSDSCLSHMICGEGRRREEENANAFFIYVFLIPT